LRGALGQPDAGLATVDARRHLVGQGAEHLPGKRLAAGQPLVGRADRHRGLHGQRVVGDREPARQLDHVTQDRGVAGDRQQHRARLVDGDAQIFDLVEGELEPGGQAGGRGAQHAEIGARGRHGEQDDVVVGLRRRFEELCHA
jgi:hypothetical protein